MQAQKDTELTLTPASCQEKAVVKEQQLGPAWLADADTGDILDISCALSLVISQLNVS